ncbi:MAG: hypothetical protein EPN47_04670 [Acidobacteria bacterium]|nr:MAG: hypothetical protein EPN47_04670 [Acidobacteriota bacterium]
MRKRIWGILAAGVVAGGLAGFVLSRDTKQATPPAPSPVEFRKGELFPTLVLPRLRDGQPGSIGDFRGKKLILHIFASW